MFALAVLPELRVTDKGLVDVENLNSSRCLYSKI
ncbi:MAG: hypothetical protein OEZ21_09690 [Candidatus Bathyarchaeota archaeon]|nr:hypothetical protein [Candidatus Bathyarchaeota archaeon]